MTRLPNMPDLSENTPAPVAMPEFDPAQEVPFEYENFCQACGYSLVGITADRCPECGHAYDTNELPFARVPWLFRKRIGWWKAYWSTVRMVLFDTRRFARELTRPARISAADARGFRRATLRIALGSYLLPLVAGFALAIARNFGLMRAEDFALAMTMGLLSVLVVKFFLWFATDMPLFIWKGLPALGPNQLAPMHQYASAPLALMPLLAALVIAGTAAVPFIDPAQAVTLAFAGVICLALIFIWLWVVALRVMKSATSCGGGRVAALALYLPLHWSIALVVAGLGFLVLMNLAGVLIHPLLR